MHDRLAIGLMPSTRADAIDAALVRIVGRSLALRPDLIAWLSHPYPADLRDALLTLRRGGTLRAAAVSSIDRRLGEIAAEASHAVARLARIPLADVAVIGYHGEALTEDPAHPLPAAIELGGSPFVAERTGVTTVSHFRSRDVAAGGRGSPLLPLADWLLLRDPLKTRLAVHLGALIKLTYLPAAGQPEDVVAFDVGPCGALLDALTHHLTAGQHPFDPGGRFAVQGVRLNALMRRWTGHPFLARRPPKSVAHEFGEPFLQESLDAAVRQDWTVRDMLCTATHFVATALADAVRQFLPADPPIAELWASGGAVKNGFLLRLVQEQFPATAVSSTDKLEIHPQAKRALLFAALAILNLDGVPANLPTLTGASGPRLLGTLTPGSPANWRRCIAYLSQPATQDA